MGVVFNVLRVTEKSGPMFHKYFFRSASYGHLSNVLDKTDFKTSFDQNFAILSTHKAFKKEPLYFSLITNQLKQFFLNQGYHLYY